MHPFSAESKEQEVIAQARLDHKMMQFFQFTKTTVQEKGEYLAIDPRVQPHIN